jgi:hypothetical protein
MYKFSSHLTGNTTHLRCVARNSDHQTTEAVYFLLHNIYKFSSYLTGNTIHLRCIPRNSDHQTTEAVSHVYSQIHEASAHLYTPSLPTVSNECRISRQQFQLQHYDDPPIISSAYGVNLEREILGSVFY